MVTPSLNHLRIVHDGSALTCMPETITLKACADAACSALYTGSVTVDLATISGATWSSDPVTFSGGQVQVTLTKATNGTVTLGGNVTAPSSMAGVCYNGATSGDCSLTYSSSACAFDAVEPGKNPGTPIFTKLAGTAFTVDVLALTNGAINTGFTGTVAVDLVDDAGVAEGSCGTTSLASPTSPTSPYTFTGGNAGRRTFTFNYANAARDVRVRMVRGTTTACSSDDFAIRPTGFSVSSPNATNTGTSGTPIIKAGAAFELDAAAVSGYTGTALINNNRIAAHSGAVQIGSLSGSFSPAVSGTSSGTGFTYSEVGNFKLNPWGVYDDGSFAAVDRGKATPECVIDNKLGTSVAPADPNVKDANGKYGCYFGNTSDTTSFGRFTPDHFAITAPSMTAACSTGTPFTYFGQDGFTTAFTITAQNAANGTTQNYVGDGSASGSWAKLPLTTSGAPGFGFAVSTWEPSQPAGSSLAITALTATNANTWVAGATTVTARHQIVRPPAEAAPTTVKVTTLPVDSDGVTAIAATEIGSSLLFFGRLHLLNAYGSELLPLRVPVRAEYYVGGGVWSVNTSDTCTVIPTTAVALGDRAPAGLGSGAAFVTLRSGGMWDMVLNKPNSAGSTDVALDLGTGTAAATACLAGWTNGPNATTAAPLAYLLGNWCGANYDNAPVARIRFGSPKAPYIYLREQY